jgi:prepilin-type processing-associated H-X9-DG protein
MFGSKHSGVVNFAYADGSVRGIRKGVDRVAYIFASAKQDGNVYDASQLGN